MSEAESETIHKWMNARKGPKLQGERAKMIWYVSKHLSARKVGQLLQVDAETVARWVHRFNEQRDRWLSR
jgi:transposase